MHLNIMVLVVWVNSRFLFLLDYIPISPKPLICPPQGFYISHLFQFLNLVASIRMENYETPLYAILSPSCYILFYGQDIIP